MEMTVEERREYHRIHYKIRTTWGNAREFTCACGAQARHWAHTHDTDRTDINNYTPMCISCHRKYDGAGKWNKGRYVGWKRGPNPHVAAFAQKRARRPSGEFI